MGLLLPAISMETMISQWLPAVGCPCFFIPSFLSFSVVSQGHIRRMGRIKDKKEKSRGKLVEFFMIYSKGEAFRSKGIHPHSVLSNSGWSLSWT